MSTTEIATDPATSDTNAGHVDTKLEVVVIPVSDVDRAAEFYVGKLGWRVDVDLATGTGRVLHVTPPGSATSVMFGTGLTPSAPGSTQFLHLVVSDIEAAHAELVAAGVESSGVFHDPTGNFNRFDPRVRAAGPDPERRTYASFVAFSDPDGNGWVLQEVTTRFPGRIDSAATSFASAQDLSSALRRAEAAYDEHAERTGGRITERPEWFAKYLVAEQAGEQLPL
ncbi:VOC family protein [Lysobacter korlensis]|uniref:VOC family protein n=1 Tax=Lysobacter korlensis TaxID=553636 RepID=A0ABV6RNC1_9GAMM